LLEYYDIFNYFITSDLYDQKNIYYVVDLYLRDNNIHATAPESRNSMGVILYKIYKEYKIEDQLDNRLIEIFNRKPDKYKKFYDAYGEYFSDNVKKSCEWMLDMKKYNL